MNTTKVYANMLAVMSLDRLDPEKLRRVAECVDVAAAFKMLADYGYAYKDGDSIDGFIVGETDALIRFIEDNAPGKAVKDALLARFVYNNCKLAYKSRFAEMPSDGYYDVGFDAEKIAAGNYEDADAYMRAALEKLDEDKVTKPQDIDIALTRAMYEKILSCKSAVVQKYFRAEIDMKNILSAARLRRLGMSGDEFIAGGKIDIELLNEAVSAESFADVFEQTPYCEFAENFETAEFKDLWRAELDSDDLLYFMTASAVADFASYKPFLNYYAQALIELKTVKTALVCIKTNARDMFYRRVPVMYKN